MRIWLGQSWQVKKSNKKFENIHVIKALGSHELIILQFFWGGDIGLYILY